MKIKKYLTQNESDRPRAQNLDLVRIIAKKIEEEQGLPEKLCCYLYHHHKRIAFDIENALQFIPMDHKVIDVASAPFLLAGALKKIGYNLVALDCAPESMGRVLELLGVEAIKCNIETEKIPVPDNYFDDVVFNEIFEHLRINPIFTLNEIIRIMKPGGVLWLSTPNIRSLTGIYNLLIKQQAFSCVGDIYAQYEHCDVVGGMGHVREYTATELCLFLEKIGFRINRIVFRGGYHRWLKQFVVKFMPTLKPFMTIVAVKPYGDAW